MSREAVEAAHNALAAAGLAPSVRSVRERLGNTGSLTTIAEHLRAIQAERSEGPGRALPDPLVAKLVEGASLYWRELAEAADAAVEAVRVEAAVDVAAAQTARDEATERAARAADELGAARAVIHSVERHLGETSARVTRLEGDLHEARAATTAAEAIAETHRDERDARERELAAAQAANERDGAIARERHAELQARADRLEEASRSAQADHTDELRTIGARLDERERSLTEARLETVRANAETTRIEDRLAERTGERDTARKETEEMRTHAKALVAGRDALAAKHAALERDGRTTALLERLVDDGRPDRVLALLESLDARLGPHHAKS